MRGDVYRVPRIWWDGIKQIRELQPGALHNVLGLPIIGADRMNETLSSRTELATIVRRGVCEFVSDLSANPRQPELSAHLTRLAWAKLHTGEATARESTNSGEIEAAVNADAVIQFLEMFDPADSNAIPGVE